MTMDSRELAKALAEKATVASIPYSEHKARVNYPYALGYLTGTVEDLLLHMTPKQRKTIAQLYGIS